MQRTPFLTKRRIIAALAIALVLAAVIVVVLSNHHKGSSAVNPHTDELLKEEGSIPLYNSGELFAAIAQNEDVLHAIWQDMTLFARTTLKQFKSPDELVSFTLDTGHTMDNSTYVFTGQFYKVSDPVRIRLTPHGKGVFTLSITNTKTGANIDNRLSLNGRRNTFIATLPIEKGNYSIRYQLPYDRIVVTFYDGYTNQDVDEAATLVTTALGSAENKDVVYSINRIGIVSLRQVSENLSTPLPKP